MNDADSLMQEPPHGYNQGSAGGSEVDDRRGRSVPLSTAAHQAQHEMFGDTSVADDHIPGFSLAGPAIPFADDGMTAHRGTLHPDEYIDPDALQGAIEQALGFTYEDVSSAYMTGRPTAETRQLRERIDSRLLALSRSGGNMALLARTMEISEKTIDRALIRARETEVAPIVVNPAVVTRHVSFITGEPGATPRRRRHVGCPNHMRPSDDRRVSTINLSDEEYARGFETQPGNPAYWEHRLATTPLKSQGLKPGARREQKFPAEYPSDESYRQFVRGAMS